MNKSIYTEYTNLNDEHKAWLDECGARSHGGSLVSNMDAHLAAISFSSLGKTFGTAGSDWYQNNSYTHIPTGSEFCEQVAEILGIEKPRFGKSLDEKLSENYHIRQIIDENSGPTFAEVAEALKGDPKDMPFNYLHRTYRVLDSLDGVPLDKRIPLSEWVPPMGAEVLFIFKEKSLFSSIMYIGKNGLAFDNNMIGANWKHFDGHWMRII